MITQLKGDLRHNNLLLVLCLLASFSVTANAGVAIMPIGYGAKSIGMLGTDMAFSDNSLSINNNPAGLTKIGGQALYMALEPHLLTGLNYRDSLGNSQDSRLDNMLLVSLGWSKPLESSPNITIGLGLFAQGGVGYDYQKLETTYGNRDELSAQFGVFRFAPVVAWQASDKLRIGLSASINYAEAEQNILPNTSDLATGFYGLALWDASGTSFSWRGGVQYAISDTLHIGLAYGHSTELNLENGKASVNFESTGIGRVNYQSAAIQGLSLPKEIGIGFGWKISPKLTVGADINWYQWSEALGKVTTTLSGPNKLLAPQQIVTVSDFGGQDQFMQSIGLEYKYSDSTTIYSGINHVGYAVKKGASNPLNNLTAKYHLGGGIEHRLNKHWQTSIVFIANPENARKYVNTDLPLGSEAEVGFSSYQFVLELNYHW
ncbi:outer membrane protein transport protein [uncultured Zhongshania sp.]|uniref:OmpP1/FadL family transporter n=1 Tax=uncultured Zhongshania sp. TaxID=1642288 RepID=UPI0025FECC7F|nr:outer membrane protein transport protein [uncultured Zhongshania sp.]